MKKLVTLLAGVALGTASFAQLTNGSTAPNFTLTDINSNSWDLYTLLNQGKTVFIDVSATWCGPCWAYHGTHALDSLYDMHGPSGTVDQMCQVLFIEGDGTTNSADLNGTGTNTQGNWVAGSPYPIIDPPASTINTFNSNYAIAYFPTIYMICPSDKKIYEVGQIGYASLVAAMNTCAYNNDVLPVGAPSLACTSTYAPTFTLKNNSYTTTLTSCTINYTIDGGSPLSYSWSGSLAAGSTTTVSLPAQSFTAGTHTLVVTATSPNGGADANNNNSNTYTFAINTANGVAAPLTNNFASTGFPYSNWVLANPDNGITWARSTANGGSLKLDCYNYATVGATDDFIIEPVDLSSTTSPSLQFNVAHAQYSSAYTDGLSVLVSTDCGTTWTQVWNKSGATLATTTATTSTFTPSTAGQWRAECVNLSAYSGQSKVFVMFRGTNGYGNNIYVDDINISNTVCATGIQNITAETGMNVYPNPVNDNATVSFNLGDASTVSVNIYNMVGELVYTNSYGNMSAGNHLVTFSSANLSNGMYFVELNAGGTRSVQKISVSK